MERHNLLVTSFAREDLNDAMTWYESQKEGLGIDFLLEFYDLCNFVEINPQINQIVYSSYRRFRMKRFPYLVYYAVDERTSDKRMVIVAVFHSSSGAEKLQQRLGDDV